MSNRNPALEKVMDQFMNNTYLHEKLLVASKNNGYRKYCELPYIMSEKKLIDNDFLCLLMEVLLEK